MVFAAARLGALILTVLTTLLTILQMPEGARRILFGLIVLFATAAHLRIVEERGVGAGVAALGRERTGSFKTRIVRSGHSASWGHRCDLPEADIAPGSSRIALDRAIAPCAPIPIFGSELKPVASRAILPSACIR